MSPEKLQSLRSKCAAFRIDLVTLLHSIQTGHPGGSLSAMEILVALYDADLGLLRVDPKNPKAADRDVFILGKGHAAPALYIVLADRGFFPKEELKTLRQLGSRLQGHPNAAKIPGVELSTGPLGLGISAAAGRALAAKMDKTPETVFALLGDGEIQEGVVWEAAMAAVKFKLDNLVAILDNNGVQLDGTTDEIMPMGDIAAKWAAFGWNVLTADGHNVEDVQAKLTEAKALKNGKPVVILAKTVKGKGVSFMEGKSAWHGKPISNDDLAAAIKELEGK
jgi:transketolase